MKIMRIRSCKDCPYCRTFLKYAYCVNNHLGFLHSTKYQRIAEINYLLNTSQQIPSWCPLEDVMFNFSVDWMTTRACRWCYVPIYTINKEYQRDNSKRSIIGNFTDHVLVCHQDKIIELLGEEKGKERIAEMEKALEDELK